MALTSDNKASSEWTRPLPRLASHSSNVYVDKELRDKAIPVVRADQ